jgi:uncharacterized oxidoreductase
VAPFGGIDRKLGTNPFSIGIPTNSDTPFVLDFATSMQAEGKVRNYLMSEKQVPLGWIIDQEGKATTNPADLYDGGAILPVGGDSQGYKGYGLSLMIEILGSMLSRNGFPGFEGHRYGSSGTVMIALDIKRFVGLDTFKAGVEQLLKDVKSSKKRPGFDEILIPGEPEARVTKKRAQEGIEIPQKLFDSIRELAATLHIDANEYLE